MFLRNFWNHHSVFDIVVSYTFPVVSLLLSIYNTWNQREERLITREEKLLSVAKNNFEQLAGKQIRQCLDEMLMIEELCRSIISDSFLGHKDKVLASKEEFRSKASKLLYGLGDALLNADEVCPFPDELGHSWKEMCSEEFDDNIYSKGLTLQSAENYTDIKISSRTISGDFRHKRQDIQKKIQQYCDAIKC